MWRLYPGDERGARLRRAFEEESKTFVRRVAPKKYHDLLIPEWAIGCKVSRLTWLVSCAWHERHFVVSVGFSIRTLRISSRSMHQMCI